MKTILTGTILLGLGASAALAADLPSRVAPPVFVAPVAAYSWTGFEAGLHSAYTFGSENRVRSGNNSYNTEKDDFANVGAGIGYNYQFTPGSGIVIGAAADADWVDLHKNLYQGNDIYHQRLDWLGTANGRLGYAFDRLLVYGTGGFAYGDPGYGATFRNDAGGQRTGGNNGQLRGGYDFGGGLAYAIPDSSFLNTFAIEKYLGLEKLIGFHLTTVVKVEYVHYDLGSSTIVVNGGGPALRYHTEGNQVRAGLVYSFGGAPAPVVARY